ncbi:MAG TPA: DUF1595 domain-containing protein [Polyangia bacterium]|nr:DUF1595 domain-containing protein [Polyangia bacterium]
MGTRTTALAAVTMFGALALGAAACQTAGTDGTTEPSAPEPAASTPATVGTGDSASIARLSNVQYDAAIRDLLGVQGLQTSNFPADTAAGDHFEQYFDAADALGEQVFSNPLLVSQLLTCTPSEDAACTRQIVASFGSRAFRGPMSPEEVDRLTKVATDAIALGETPVNSIKQVVKTVLASPQFLYTVQPTTL